MLGPRDARPSSRGLTDGYSQAPRDRTRRSSLGLAVWSLIQRQSGPRSVRLLVRLRATRGPIRRARWRSPRSARHSSCSMGTPVPSRPSLSLAISGAPMPSPRCLDDLDPGRIRQVTGLEHRPHYSASKILWWLTHEVSPRGWRVALVQDFIAGRLGLPAATDPSLASRTMLLDRHTRSWSPELLDALLIGPDRLPQVVEAGSDIGAIDRAGREALGLRHQCRYVVAGLDAACMALGVGAIEPGQRVLALGTVGAIAGVLDAEADGGAIPTGPHVVPNARLAIGAAQAAGAALRWWRGIIAGPGPDQESATLTFERLLGELDDRAFWRRLHSAPVWIEVRVRGSEGCRPPSRE